MEKKLVFDIGMHIGQDTKTYLAEGFRVVAVEANPQLAAENQKRFSKYIANGSLIILNVGISDREGSLPFYINKRTSEWSSFDFDMGARNGTPYEVVEIPCITSASLFEKYGMPYFMKVDIEGLDYLCINHLPSTDSNPNIRYVSCEATDISLLDTLRDKGYDKFKLINQAFHFTPINLKLERNRLFHRFLFVYGGVRLRLRKLSIIRHPYSSSGPIPEKTSGDWLSYEAARALFIEYNEQLPPYHKSWFDFHATY